MYQMEAHLKTCNITPVDSTDGEKCSQTPRATIGNLHREHLEIRKYIFPAVYEPVSAALSLLETSVIAPVWVMI